MNTIFKQIIIRTLLLSFFTGFSATCMYEEADLHICQLLTYPSNLQIYQFIKAIGNDNDPAIPSDVMNIIMAYVCQITTQENQLYYHRENKRKSMPDVIIDFIENSLIKKRRHTTIVHIIRKALQVSGKSLSDIKSTINTNVFHHLFFESPSLLFGTDIDYRRLHNRKNNIYWARILCRVAKKQAWDLITKTGSRLGSALYYACIVCDKAVLEKFLQKAPSDQEIWKTVSTTSMKGRTKYHGILDSMIFHKNKDMSWIVNNEQNVCVDMMKKLLSFAPNNQQAWKLIMTPPPNEEKNALDLTYDVFNLPEWKCDSTVYKAIVDIRRLLKSYRPQGQ